MKQEVTKHEPRYYVSPQGDKLRTVHRVTCPGYAPSPRADMLVIDERGTISSSNSRYCLETPEAAIQDFIDQESKYLKTWERKFYDTQAKLSNAVKLKEELEN